MNRAVADVSSARFDDGACKFDALTVMLNIMAIILGNIDEKTEERKTM